MDQATISAEVKEKNKSDQDTNQASSMAWPETGVKFEAQLLMSSILKFGPQFPFSGEDGEEKEEKEEKKVEELEKKAQQPQEQPTDANSKTSSDSNSKDADSNPKDEDTAISTPEKKVHDQAELHKFSLKLLEG